MSGWTGRPGRPAGVAADGRLYLMLNIFAWRHKRRRNSVNNDVSELGESVENPPPRVPIDSYQLWWWCWLNSGQAVGIRGGFDVPHDGVYQGLIFAGEQIIEMARFLTEDGLKAAFGHAAVASSVPSMGSLFRGVRGCTV